MGNLHDGHLSLCRIARQHGDVVVTSIFVNRLQFGPNEDFDRYPRTLEADRAGLEREGVDVLFAPKEHEMYPTPQVYRVQPPPLAEELDGASRPGFFHGVCTVVLKLFNLVQPDVAVFGKKDRQQLKIVRGMVQQFNMRDPDRAGGDDPGGRTGSRSRRATTTCRRRSARRRRTSTGCCAASPTPSPAAAPITPTSRPPAGWSSRNRGWKVDYVAIRHGLALRIPHPEGFDHPNLLIVLAAATLGTTRLIDNVDVIKKDGED